MQNNTILDNDIYTITLDSVDISLANMASTIPVTTQPQYSFTAAGTHTADLYVTGNADFEGDVTIKGKSLVKTLEGIEQRLAILTPDPAKLEKYAALREAYEHYKMLEALIGDE